MAASGLSSEPAILIVGARRSGTTLLHAMLSQHPDLLVHPEEPQFVLELLQRFGQTVRDVPAALRLIDAHPYRAPAVTRDALERIVGAEGPLPLHRLVQAYLTVWRGDESRDKRPVLKHPRLIFHLDLARELFPASTVVHVVRDPRGNVLSQRARWPDIPILECAAWWRAAVRRGHALALRRPDACIEVVYERLVRDPERTMRELCSFLRLPFTSDLLSFELETQVYSPAAEPRPAAYTRPDASRLGRWRTGLTPTEIRLVERWCRREMPWWGYDPVHPATSALRFWPFYWRERLRNGGRAAARQGRRIRERESG